MGQTNAMLPVEQQVVYRHAGHAMSSIMKEEGFMGLFKGALPTSVRAMGLNLGMLGGNSVAKDFVKDTCGVTGTANVFGASAIAGFFASAFSLPFDFVKTQIQKQ